MEWLVIVLLLIIFASWEISPDFLLSLGIVQTMRYISQATVRFFHFCRSLVVFLISLITLATLTACLLCFLYGFFVPFAHGIYLKFRAPLIIPDAINSQLDPTESDLEEHDRADKRLLQGIGYMAAGGIPGYLILLSIVSIEKSAFANRRRKKRNRTLLNNHPMKFILLVASLSFMVACDQARNDLENKSGKSIVTNDSCKPYPEVYPKVYIKDSDPLVTTSGTTDQKEGSENFRPKLQNPGLQNLIRSMGEKTKHSNGPSTIPSKPKTVHDIIAKQRGRSRPAR